MELCKLCPNPRDINSHYRLCKDCRLRLNREKKKLIWDSLTLEQRQVLNDRSNKCITKRYHSDPEFRARAQKSGRERGKAKSKQYRAAKYGLTLAQWDDLFLSQNSKCAICKREKPGGIGDWHIDHDHTTGKVRGLLCYYCNTGLGMFSDLADNLNRAYLYLLASKGPIEKICE